MVRPTPRAPVTGTAVRCRSNRSCGSRRRGAPLAAAVSWPRHASPQCGDLNGAPAGPFQLHPKLLRPPGRFHPGDLPLRTEAQNGIQPVPPGHVCEFPSVSSWDGQVPRASGPRGLATFRPRPAILKGSASLRPVRQCRWPGVLSQVFVRGAVDRGLPSCRHASLLHTEPPHTASLAKALQPSYDPAMDAPIHHDRRRADRQRGGMEWGHVHGYQVKESRR